MDRAGRSHQDRSTRSIEGSALSVAGSMRGCAAEVKGEQRGDDGPRGAVAKKGGD